MRAEGVEVKARSLPQNPSKAVLVDLPKRGVVLLLSVRDRVQAGRHPAAVPTEETQLHAGAHPGPRVHVACPRGRHSSLNKETNGAAHPLLRVRHVGARPHEQSELPHHCQKRELRILRWAQELGVEGVGGGLGAGAAGAVAPFGRPQALFADCVAEVHEGGDRLAEPQPLQREPLGPALLALAPSPAPGFERSRVLGRERLRRGQEAFESNALLSGEHHRLDIAAAAVLEGGRPWANLHVQKPRPC
mmetsp:Transcript_39735/g.114667  ORF Transcript_39735/g.114667 Transcript_39735/m.114667 type:complete len:247 (-) Transcript_39735:168-908(-)